MDLGGRTGTVGPPPFSREQGGCDIQLANIAPDGRAEKECVIGKVTVRHHLFHSSLLLSCYYLKSFSTELCPAAASLKSLLLCMMPLSPTVHVRGRMSKVRHSLMCQRMAKFASLCCEVLSKEKVEQTECRCVVTYVVFLRHGQVITLWVFSWRASWKHFLQTYLTYLYGNREVQEW